MFRSLFLGGPKNVVIINHHIIIDKNKDAQNARAQNF